MKMTILIKHLWYPGEHRPARIPEGCKHYNESIERWVKETRAPVTWKRYIRCWETPLDLCMSGNEEEVFVEPEEWVAAVPGDALKRVFVQYTPRHSKARSTGILVDYDDGCKKPFVIRIGPGRRISVRECWKRKTITRP